MLFERGGKTVDRPERGRSALGPVLLEVTFQAYKPAQRLFDHFPGAPAAPHRQNP